MVFIIYSHARDATRVDFLASRSHITQKSCSWGQKTHRDFKEQTMSQIIGYYLFLQLCSFLLILPLCHGQGEEGELPLILYS